MSLEDVKLYTYQDLARLCGVHVDTVRRWVKAGRLTAWCPTKRTVRFRDADVRYIMEGSAVPIQLKLPDMP